LMAQRVLAGVASAFIFISGGLLAARLGAMHGQRAGFLIGLYYGGTGLGITVSALLVPAALEAGVAAGAPHAWQWAWLALGVACVAATAAMVTRARDVGGAPGRAGSSGRLRLSPFAFGMTGDFMFGVGYVGYMTFVVALLKEQGMRADAIVAFYAALGLAVVA